MTRGNAVVNFNGGIIQTGLSADDSSIVNFRGGSIGNNLSAFSSSAVNFFGSGLSDTLISNVGGFSKYKLSGKLADGTDISGKSISIQTGAGASLTLINSVPEPGSLAFLIGITTIGAIFLRKRRATKI